MIVSEMDAMWRLSISATSCASSRIAPGWRSKANRSPLIFSITSPAGSTAMKNRPSSPSLTVKRYWPRSVLAIVTSAACPLPSPHHSNLTAEAARLPYNSASIAPVDFKGRRASRPNTKTSHCDRPYRTLRGQPRTASSATAVRLRGKPDA